MNEKQYVTTEAVLCQAEELEIVVRNSDGESTLGSFLFIRVMAPGTYIIAKRPDEEETHEQHEDA